MDDRDFERYGCWLCKLSFIGPSFTSLTSSYVATSKGGMEKGEEHDAEKFLLLS